jgi:hypothetical protein
MFSGLAEAQSDINFSHKSIDREIRKSFQTEEFRLHYLNPADTALYDSTGYEHYYIIYISSAPIGYLYIGRVNCCRAGGCSSLPDEHEATVFEYFDYLILYDLNSTIRSVRIINYQASYGHEISSSSWLKQFVGYTYGKGLSPGDTIDGITGATVSVVSIVSDVERASASLAQMLNHLDE